jgi:hypothetical protein
MRCFTKLTAKNLILISLVTKPFLRMHTEGEWQDKDGKKEPCEKSLYFFKDATNLKNRVPRAHLLKLISYCFFFEQKVKKDYSSLIKL